MEPWMQMAALGVSIILAVGFAGKMVINTVAKNLMRIKAASAAPLQPAQEQRMAQMEAEIAALKDEVGRLAAVESFYAQLQKPAAPARPTTPPGGQ